MIALIVEDDLGTCELVAEKVAECGYRTSIVRSAVEGLEYLKLHPVSLMILDYALPDMDGIEFVEALRAMSQEVPPFVVTTGRGDERVAVDMMKLGARDYVVKDAYFFDILPKVVTRISRELENERRLQQVEAELRNSEAKFRSAFENARLAVSLVSLDGRYLQVNNQFSRMLGYSREELEARSIHDVTYPEDQNISYDFIDRSLAGTISGSTFEKRYLHRDGHIVYGQVSSALVNDSEGKPLYFISHVQDITEQRRMEALLRQQATWSEFIHDAVIITDLNLRITHWNKAATAIYGWTEDEALGKVVDTLLNTEFVNITSEAAQATLRQTGLWQGQIRQRTKTGEAILIDASVTFLKDDDTHITGGITINRDITERQEAEKQRLELTLERERVKILANFISRASHEFRTPLSVISSSAYLMGRASDPNAQDLKLRQIENQVKDIARLVDMLAFMTQLDSKPLDLDLEEVDLNETLSVLYSNLQPVLEENHLEGQLELAGDYIGIRADSHYLRQGLQYFLDNAVRFTPAGGMITLRLKCAEDKAIIEIVDTGFGMGKEALTRIFERFYRENETGSNRGFGLGLSIARILIEQHQGTIEVESELGKGSTFRVLLSCVCHATPPIEQQRMALRS